MTAMTTPLLSSASTGSANYSDNSASMLAGTSVTVPPVSSGNVTISAELLANLVAQASAAAKPSTPKTVTVANGLIYTGDLLDGVPQGQGSAIYPENKMGFYKWTGEFARGVPHGRGTLEKTNGSSFVGRMENGMPTEGKLTSSTNAVCSGTFRIDDNGGFHLWDGKQKMMTQYGEYYAPYKNGKRADVPACCQDDCCFGVCIIL